MPTITANIAVLLPACSSLAILQKVDVQLQQISMQYYTNSDELYKCLLSTLLWWTHKIGSNWVALYKSCFPHCQSMDKNTVARISSDISTHCLPLPHPPPLPLSCPPPPLLPLRCPPRIRTRPLTSFLLSIRRLSPSHLQQPVCSLNWHILVVSHHLKQVTSILSGCVQSMTCVLYLYLIVATCVYQYGRHVH